MNDSLFKYLKTIHNERGSIIDNYYLLYKNNDEIYTQSTRKKNAC